MTIAKWALDEAQNFGFHNIEIEREVAKKLQKVRADGVRFACGVADGSIDLVENGVRLPISDQTGLAIILRRWADRIQNGFEAGAS